MDLDEARSAAEARRQRILDSAANRMDQVSGLAGSDGKEAEETATTLPTSSKLAAMRKRRFRKSSAAATTEGTSTGTTTTTTPKETTESSARKEMTPPIVQAKETTPEPAKAQEEKKPTSEKTEEKKYVGVAKMRRKMIKEKQQKKQEEKADEIPVSIPKKFSKVYTPRPTWQIMMHLLTVLFLFLAGFEVGLQQSVIEYRDDLTIHETLAPQQEMRLLNKGVSLSSFSPTPAVIKEAKNQDPPPTPYVSDEQDEFDTAGKQDAKEEKLDPLFGVDLDALTAGPGLFMMFGRFAVSIHRMILSFLYYLPIRMWNNALSLVASPPVLCLATLAIRQASHAVGGKLPELIAEEAKTSTQPQDIMTTIKNGVTSLIGRTFPTATKLYEAWTHLRSDMYVVLCGLFVGLVWHHYLSSMLMFETPTNDEL